MTDGSADNGHIRNARENYRGSRDYYASEHDRPWMAGWEVRSDEGISNSRPAQKIYYPVNKIGTCCVRW